jgi:hypothetical protein
MARRAKRNQAPGAVKPNRQSVKTLIEDGIACLSVAYLGSSLLVHDGHTPKDLADALATSSAGLSFDRAAPRGAHRRDIKADLARAHQRPALGLALLQGVFCNLLVVVRDEMDQASIGPKRKSAKPLYQLLRHLRNAVAHGNKFYLKDGEPKSPASYRKFHVDAKMDGQTNVLFDFISPGDILDLLEAIHADL